MANKIQIKRTTVTGRTPNTSDPANTRYIDAGELSLNLTDGKLFSSNGTVYFEVGANLNSLSVGGDKLTANSTLVNAVALNVVNQTNTATLYVTTSANVGTALAANATSVNSTVVVNISNATTSGNNVSGAVLVTGGVGVGDSVYVKNRVGFANSTNISVVYQVYNSVTNSLDTVFG